MDDNSKLSVNNMVELAMGLSMASLFSQAMNSAFANSTRMLKEDQQLNAPAKYIYAIIGGAQKGPYSLGEIVTMIKESNITPETYMWKPGMPEWKQAKDITDIAPGIALPPPVIPENGQL